MKKCLKLCAVFGLLVGFRMEGVAAVAVAQHVVVIGCDGMGSIAFEKARAPNLRQLMRTGAFTLRARGVMPTSSSSNWASMIMGAGPEQHGVTSNDWQTNKFDFAPIAVGSGGMFPTIFGVLREQRPKAVIACFHDWGDFGRLLERSALNVMEDTDGPLHTVERGIACIKAQKPNFLFLHLDHVDHASHEFGWGSPQYLQAVELADTLIGDVLQALDAAGIRQKTIVFITADHGGKDKGHGGQTMQELEIPWIISGPGIAAGKELTTPVNTYDTAVTLAYILGLKTPACWIGRPVREAFKAYAGKSR